MTVAALPILLAGALAVGLTAVRTNPRPIPEAAVKGRPVQVDGDGYVTSQACRACHPRQYAAWRASYHRTMTTVATPETAVPNFDGVELTNRTGRYRLERRGDEFWAELDDPDGPNGNPRGTEPPRIRRQIVLVTGSHHQQVFWYATGRGRLIGQLPLTYLTAEQRWVPRRSAFLDAPVSGAISETGHWNAVCIGCHTTNGRPRLSQPFGSAPLAEIDVDSRVSELGIACEACHGPGAEHIRLNRNPVRRYSLHLTGRSDPTIVLPTRLDPRASAEVCGQCHSVWELYDEQGERYENDHGVPYKPGGELRKWRFVAQPTRNLQSATMRALLRDDPGFVSESFWPDGMVSVTGREYNGLIDSPCYVRGNARQGTMTCLSCHAMHEPAGDPRPMHEWADDQLKPGMNGNDACLQCHESFRTNLQAHTRHARGSTGSSCYNCHMPYTTYGLLKGIRSHQISSPDVRTSLATGRPNACNLCHLDQTLGWAADYLEKWYGTRRPALGADEQSVAASLLWLLRGDEQQRAIVAYNFGWAAAQQASRTEWMAPFLAVLLEDPYEAVRFIAFRSLRTLPGFARLDYDFIGDGGERARARRDALQIWSRTRGPSGESILIDPGGSLRADLVNRLLRERNDRRVFLRE